jgi:hypothetical protein
MTKQDVYLWGFATRGLFGCIRILEDYLEYGLPGGPSHDFIKAAMRLRNIAQRLEDSGQANNSQSFDRPK